MEGIVNVTRGACGTGLGAGVDQELPMLAFTKERLGFPGLRKKLTGGASALLFSAALGISPAFAAHGGGGHGGGGHGGGGFHGGGFHGGGFHAGGFRGGHVYAGGFHGGRYYGGRYYGGWNGGFYPGFGLGLALGLGYPWGWGYYPTYASYYGTAAPYAAARNWYYCANPAGYYPYVTQCYSGWQTVPAG
jgi:hypothetical protein